MNGAPQKYHDSTKKDHSRATSEELPQFSSITGWAALLSKVRFWRGSYLCSLCCQDELPAGCLCVCDCDLVLSCK